MTSLGKGVFYSCEELEHVELPSSLREIRDSAFAYCRVLRAIKIPEGVTRLGERVFYSCEELVAAYVPQHLQLGDRVFEGVDAGFVRYTDIKAFNSLEVVADVDRRAHELNNRPIVRLTKQPYFQISNRAKGVGDISRCSRDITNVIVSSKAKTDGVSGIFSTRNSFVYFRVS